MSERSKTFGLSPEKIAELLRMGTEEYDHAKASAEQKKAELLVDRLAELLPLDSAIMKLLPDISSLLTGVMGECGGESIGDLLQNPEVGISVLRKIKNYNNDLSKCAESKIERDIAVVLYYGSIASALVFHNKRISRFSYKNLERSFSSLVGKSWITTELVRLFTKAREICRELHKKSHGSDK
jgi:hypothetical protein